MKLILLVLLSCIIGCTSTQHQSNHTKNTNRLLNDQIEKLRLELSGSFLFQNGLYSPINLPSDATPEELVKSFYSAFEKFKNKPTYEIITSREINIHNTPFIAVHLNTNKGSKILLFQFEGYYWWNRAYDTSA